MVPPAIETAPVERLCGPGWPHGWVGARAIGGRGTRARS
jgi:hypothetical protein